MNPEQWWETTIDNFKKDMAAIGVEVYNVYFTGFGSQGDGACFAGKIRHWEKFLRSAGHTDPVLIDHASRYWCLVLEHRGSYYHEYAIHFDYYFPMPDDRTDEEGFIEAFSPYENDFRSRAWFAVLDQYSSRDFAQEFADVFQNHMRRLYRLLEKEYERCAHRC